MAIRTESSKQAYEASPNTHQVIQRGADTHYMVITHVGMVLETRERNYYDDSDFYARVWNEEKQCVENVEYATTRAWTYLNSAVVDATPEVLAKADAWERAKAAEVAEQVRKVRAKDCEKGRVVKVVKGKKVALGTTGVIFWFGEDYARPSRYGSPHRHLIAHLLPQSSNRKVGIVDKDGNAHWTYEKNLQVELDANGDAVTGKLTRNGKTYKWEQG